MGLSQLMWERLGAGGIQAGRWNARAQTGRCGVHRELSHGVRALGFKTGARDGANRVDTSQF